MRNRWIQLTVIMGMLGVIVFTGCEGNSDDKAAFNIAKEEERSSDSTDDYASDRTDEAETDAQTAVIQAKIKAIDIENTTHIELELMEGVMIDADVTPYERYQDGVSAYYYENYMEGIERNVVSGEGNEAGSEADAVSGDSNTADCEDYTADDFAEHPSLLGQDLELQAALLESYLSCDLDLDSMSFERNTNSDYYYITDGSFYELTIPDAAGEMLYAVWQKHDADGRLPELRFRYPNEYVLEKKDEAQEAVVYNYPLAESLMNNSVSSNVASSGSAEDEETEQTEIAADITDVVDEGTEQTKTATNLIDAAAKGRELVAALTGLSVSEENLVVPLEVSEESDVEVYAFYYFFEKDGLPLVRMAISTKYTNDLVLSEELEEIWNSGESLANGILFGAWVFCEGNVAVEENTADKGDATDGSDAIDEESVGDEATMQAEELQLTGVEINMDISISEEIYKEKEAVVDVRTALLSMMELFKDVKLDEEITVTDIRLVYNTSFSNGEDGEEAMPVLTPYWCFTYYMEDRGNVLLMFDAYTGEFAGSGIFKGNADTGL